MPLFTVCTINNNELILSLDKVFRFGRTRLTNFVNTRCFQNYFAPSWNMCRAKISRILGTRAVNKFIVWKKLGVRRERAFEFTKIAIKTLHFNNNGRSEKRYGHSILWLRNIYFCFISSSLPAKINCCNNFSFCDDDNIFFNDFSQPVGLSKKKRRTRLKCFCPNKFVSVFLQYEMQLKVNQIIFLKDWMFSFKRCWCQ